MQTAYIEPNATPPGPPTHLTRLPGRVVSRKQEEIHETVYLVSLDYQLHRATADFLSGLKIRLISFCSEHEYLSSDRKDAAACLIYDMRLSNAAGLEAQQRLRVGSHPPLVFVTDDCDVPTTVCALRAGAIEVLLKPVEPSVLLPTIQTAFSLDRRARQRKVETEALQRRYALLTLREREVLPLVVGGLLNKQSAALLDISEVTLQIHRSHVMRKMEADSFADLVRMAVKLKIQHWRSVRGIETSRSEMVVSCHS